VDPQRNWPSPAEGQHAVRNWHGKRQQTGCTAVQQWHGKMTREAARRCPVAQHWHDTRETSAAEHDPLCESDTAQETQVSKQSRSTASRTRTAEESDKKPFYERNSENDPLRDCRQEDREANSRVFCRIMTGQGLDLVEGSTPSKTKKKRLQAEEE
jgi:hypothetical protein